MTIFWSWIVGKWFTIPLRYRIYAGAALVTIAALFRWRAAGIQAALEEVRRRDEERANELAERADAARLDHPADDGDVVERLRNYGRLRQD